MLCDISHNYDIFLISGEKRGRDTYFLYSYQVICCYTFTQYIQDLDR